MRQSTKNINKAVMWLLLTFSILFATFEVRNTNINSYYEAGITNNLLERHTGESTVHSNIRFAVSVFRSDLSFFQTFNISRMRNTENQTPARPLHVDANQLEAINGILNSTPKIRRFSIKLYSKYVRLHGYCQKRMLIATAPTLGEAIVQLQTQAAAISS